MLQEALDSHQYWQLSDRQYRASGYIMETGSDDPDDVRAIAACGALSSKLARALGSPLAKVER